ncbi:MAG: type II secretion system F family protein [Candidatus Roizmanbacteria bacterium]|nr:type II secretion system F family protein [Candidatus Roizmanbacteria bacterium]
MLFEYTVSDKSRRINKGTFEASTKEEAIRLLKDKGYLIVSIQEKHTVGDYYYQYLAKTKLKLSFGQLVDFTRQLGIMINAGLSIVDALSIIIRQNRDPRYHGIAVRIQDRIKSGGSFSDGLKEFPDTFQNFYIALIRAGESSGKLDDVLMRLAENLEKSREFRGKVVNALIYPIIVVLGMMVVGFVLMTFVLPQLLDLYNNFNIDLPLSTQIIIAISHFSQQYWPFIIIATIGGAIYARILIKREKVRKHIDGLTLRIPVFGKIIQQSVLVESTRTLSILLSSGVPLLEALSIVTNTSDNLVYQAAFGNVQKNVERGVSLGDALTDENVFPDIFVQMTSVGEKTGQLDDTLMRLSRYFQMETELAVKAATTLIEPLVLVVLGIGVGFLVVSVLTPIYNLTSSFGVAR